MVKQNDFDSEAWLDIALQVYALLRQGDADGAIEYLEDRGFSIADLARGG